jgi:HNH endonuclease
MTAIKDRFPHASENGLLALRFYQENYFAIGEWVIEPGKKITLGDMADRTCRFCDGRPPEVTFKTKAHAIPESLGNKSLFTAYECDACNQFFGRGIENDFGNWIKPQHLFGRIKGKKGVPKVKKGSSRGWRLEWRADHEILEITQSDDDPVAVLDTVAKLITFTLPRDPYIPIAVLKAFTKMGLTLLPGEELPNFRSAMVWIRNPDHNVGLVKEFPVLHTFVPGDRPFRKLAAVLLRRRTDELRVPYVTFVLTYGNEVFQTVLPSPERDAAIFGQEIQYCYFPNVYDLGVTPKEPIGREGIDLTGRSLVKGEKVHIRIGYQ